jgi:hypothetical protein
MITVKKLKTILQEFPDDATCSAYEGEDVGINIRWKNSETGVAEYYFIRCTEDETED